MVKNISLFSKGLFKSDLFFRALSPITRLPSSAKQAAVRRPGCVPPSAAKGRRRLPLERALRPDAEASLSSDCLPPQGTTACVAEVVLSASHPKISVSCENFLFIISHIYSVWLHTIILTVNTEVLNGPSGQRPAVHPRHRDRGVLQTRCSPRASQVASES